MGDDGFRRARVGGGVLQRLARVAHAASVGALFHRDHVRFRRTDSRVGGGTALNARGAAMAVYSFGGFGAGFLHRWYSAPCWMSPEAKPIPRLGARLWKPGHRMFHRFDRRAV